MEMPNSEIIRRWTKMTDDNMHTDVRFEIANWYAMQTGDEDYALAFVHLLTEHEKRGYLEKSLYAIRNIITDAMMDKIKKADQRIYDAINGCL